MGKISKRSRRVQRLGTIEKEILEELSLGDLLVGFLCSVHSTRRMYRIAHERAMHRYRTRKAIDRLTAEGYVRRRGEHLAISGSGRQLLGAVIVQTRASLRTTTWDGKWRIITFDIPEELRLLRNAIRAILKRAGFVQLQRSTWIFPHECEELSRLIKQDTRLSSHVLYGVLEKIENDARLRHLFALA